LFSTAREEKVKEVEEKKKNKENVLVTTRITMMDGARVMSNFLRWDFLQMPAKIVCVCE
jgi:transcriptional regulatory protein LevR